MRNFKTRTSFWLHKKDSRSRLFEDDGDDDVEMVRISCMHPQKIIQILFEVKCKTLSYEVLMLMEVTTK